ncbi:helix-turn-helix transcriptional regulator [Halomonas sp. I1]|uniref:helix-turn-helix domain-containing protein n=1 Tax=Halomonas sp. I1 TaxID=393536 RepID=UPI0028DF9C95|nr:helix-turn-helix transcriptional regulator [Halomonas sp. I1]MDT8894164.1 helix-turn-helix transcriptional regulator [Halomonas sp. I1]
MDTLGPRIKQLRMEAQLNKAALARRVGVSDVTISYWESGTIKQIGHERLVALARALGCPLSALLDGSKESPRPEALTAQRSHPLPWEADRFGGNALRSAHTAHEGCHLVSPAPGSDFDFLGPEDLAGILPVTDFEQPGLYLIELDDQLAIRHVYRNAQGKLLGQAQDDRHPETPLSPDRLLGKLVALWRRHSV